jgi:hypothetical protein
LAKRLQCPVRRVTYKRKSLHIPPCPAGQTVQQAADSLTSAASALTSTPS